MGSSSPSFEVKKIFELPPPGMYETQMKNWIIIILGESQDFCTIYSIMSWIWIFPPSHQEFLQERLHPSDPRGGDASSYARIRWVLGESHLPLKAEGQGHPNQENPRENHQKSIKQTWKPWENHQQPWKNHQKPLKRPSKTIEKKTHGNQPIQVPTKQTNQQNSTPKLDCEISESKGFVRRYFLELAICATKSSA